MFIEKKISLNKMTFEQDSKEGIFIGYIFNLLVCWMRVGGGILITFTIQICVNVSF